jgi:ferrous-iron efflux pump FieF
MTGSQTAQEGRLNISAGLASVTVAITLVALKLWALSQTGALTIAATLVDSALDLLMSAGGLVAMLYAQKPADEDHAFGHSSAEDLAALMQSAFVLVSAAVIAGAALQRLLAETPPRIESEGAGAVVLGLSIVLTAGLVLWQRRVVKRTGNRVVAADSLHYVGDLMPALGGLVALWASAAYGLTRIDSVVALAAAAVMLLGAVTIGRRAFDALMDRRADPEVIAGIGGIAGRFPGVRGYHDLRTRTAGSRIFVNIHIELDGSQSLDEAHAISAALRREILRAYPRADVMIHKDPVGVARHPEDPRLRP